MSDDKLFNYLVSRVQGRESASIALATIASSASLVLLGLSIHPQSLTKVVLGVGFVFIGFAYNEITFRTIQRNDLKTIWGLIEKESGKEGLDKIHYEKLRRTRLLLSRSLLLFPLFGWTWIVDISYSCKIVMSIIIIVAIFVLLFTVPYDKNKS